MTMILAAHLGEHILIASDRRTMSCNIKTGEMRISHDNESKTKVWHKGAIAGSGEKVFLDRIAEYFKTTKNQNNKINQMRTIYDELKIRLNEGIPKLCLINNSIIFSLFNGKVTHLYSIQINQFFQTFIENGIEIIQPEIKMIKPWDVDVTCFNMPPDMSNLQEFQRNLKAHFEFKSDMQFISHYINELKKIFAHQASIDPSITSSFDVFFQCCSTGESINFYIENPLLEISNSQSLNYWDRF